MMFYGVTAAWTGHTDDSRAFAQDVCEALMVCGISHKAAALTMGLSHEQQLSRQLAGAEPLNAFRLLFLPPAFRVALLRRQAARLGAAVIAPEDLALLRGAAEVGAAKLAAIVPWVTRPMAKADLSVSTKERAS